MALKIGKVKVDDNIVDKIIIENEQDVANFFEEKSFNDVADLRGCFLRCIERGEVVILSVKVHPMSGFHTWCTAGKDNFIVL
jgi:hypothetical protein